MTQIQLPSHIAGTNVTIPSDTRQVTIVGGSGAGKSRFMRKMWSNCSPRAYSLSVLEAMLPSESTPLEHGSIDELYDKAVRRLPYMRTDAMSQIDKLTYMLFADEFESLIALKESGFFRSQESGKRAKPRATKLDRIKGLWERIFPGNKILRKDNTLMFSTRAGDDAIEADRLSQSELAVLYYTAGVLYAMENAVIFIDTPTLFLHPSSFNTIWNSIEQLRPDCTFVYNSVDEDFVSSRTQNVTLWVKGYDAARKAWDYEILRPGELREDMLVELVGTRNPVLFIEGDAQHSIDAKLYTLVFDNYTVKPMGSCDKVIETTRSFSTLRGMHHLDSHGIVDRDRRTPNEVSYLRKRNIMVPEVAEVENIFLAENVVKTVAGIRGRSPEKVYDKLKLRVIKEFKSQLDEQALQHVRHRMKRLVECRIDGRFNCITALETHIKSLVNILNPRKEYNELRNAFLEMAAKGDYEGILRVFNHKPMLGSSGISQSLGYPSKEDYIAGVLEILKRRTPEAEALRNAIKGLITSGMPDAENKKTPKDK